MTAQGGERMAWRLLVEAQTLRAAAVPDPEGDDPAELERLRLVADRLDGLAVELLDTLPAGEAA